MKNTTVDYTTINTYTATDDELQAAIVAARADVALYERLSKAQQRLSLIDQAVRTRAEQKAAAERNEAEIAKYEILTIARHPNLNEKEPHVLDLQEVTARIKTTGTLCKFTLPNCSPQQVQAVLRAPKKIPAAIRKLGDTPEAALTRWAIAVGRGYLAG